MPESVRVFATCDIGQPALDRLREKGYLSRRKIKGTYHYSPRIAKREMLAGMVRRFVEESLEGSVSPFIAYLAERPSLTDAEVSKLKELVREIEDGRQEKRR